MNIKSAISVVSGLAVIAILIGIFPMIGQNVDDAWTADPQAKATGVLTFSNQPSDGETFNISTDRYEYDTGDGVGAGNFDINVGGTLVATLGATVTCVNANDTAGVNATNSTTTLNLTADAFGTAGNAIATTETITNAAFGATTLTGGLDASAWNATVNTDLTTGSGFWTDMLLIAVLGTLVTIIAFLVLRPLIAMNK